MKNKGELITVIIPCRENEAPKSLPLLHRLKRFRIEIILVKGNHPSVQRNAALKKAKGAYVYFLDSDSIPGKENFRILLDFFANHPDAGGLGGPSLPPRNSGTWQKIMGILLGHPLGTIFIYRRYSPYGRTERVGDESLILANMAIRKKMFKSLGGFHEKLYPNEENEFIDRCQKAGWSFYRDPDFLVNRPNRRNLREFIRQMWIYGRGRGEQLRVSFSSKSLVWVGLAISLTFFNILTPMIGAWIYWTAQGLENSLGNPAALAVLLWLGYLVMIALPALVHVIKGPAYLFLMPLFYLTHTLYGAGIAYSFFVPSRSARKKPWYKLEIQKQV